MNSPFDERRNNQPAKLNKTVVLRNILKFF